MVSLFLSYNKLKKKKMPPKNFLHGSWEGLSGKFAAGKGTRRRRRPPAPPQPVGAQLLAPKPIWLLRGIQNPGAGAAIPEARGRGGAGPGWAGPRLPGWSQPRRALGPAVLGEGGGTPRTRACRLGSLLPPTFPPLWPGLLGFRPGSVWRHSLSPGKDTFLSPKPA